MRDYAKVSPTFWTGKTGKDLRRRGAEAVVVAMYLMSSPHSNMLGLFYQPTLYMAHETGLGVEGASKGLAECVEAGFCSFDEASEVVWVHEMALYQIGEHLKPADKRCKGVAREYEALPDCPFLGAFYDRYARAYHMRARRSGEGEPPLAAVVQVVEAGPQTMPLFSANEAPSEGVRSQEQEQEQEQEKTPPPPAVAGGALVGDEFGNFWAHWPAGPRKVAEDQCRRKWQRLGLAAVAGEVLQGLELAKQSPAWRKNGGEFVPAPLTWLAQRRWEAPLAPDEGACMPWFDTRSGIEGRGVELGLGRWDERAFSLSQGEPFAAYEARVMRAAGLQPIRVAA